LRKTLKVDVLTVSERPVVLTVSVDLAVPAHQDKDVLEEHVSVTEVALDSSVDLTDVVPPAVNALLDKLASQENVLELAHPNVFVLTEPSELAVGTDVEDAVEAAQLASDAVTELANATLTVKTDTVVKMVVEDLAVPAKMVPSAKLLKIPTPDNATSTVSLKSELKLERLPPETWSVDSVMLTSLVL
jgi:hypothetical protein